VAEKAPGTRLLLIRHGESQVTVDQVVGGHRGCTGLSPLGRKQAELLRERLARTGEVPDPAALYASVLPRAIETAEIIAPALGDLPVQQDCGVCEVHPGEADGLTWQEFSDRFGVPAPGEHYRPWAPGAESWSSFVARVGVTILDLVERHAGQTVVVACHGGVIDAAFVVLGGLPVRRPFDTFVTNTAITEWAEAPSGRWALLRYNDAAHLAGLS
jgi:probable phosphoglycerate mutase